MTVIFLVLSTEFKTQIEKLKRAINLSTWERQIELLLPHNEVLDLVTRDHKVLLAALSETAAANKKDDALVQLMLVRNKDDSNIELASN